MGGCDKGRYHTLMDTAVGVKKHGAGCMVVANIGDVDRYLGQVRVAAARIRDPQQREHRGL